MQVVDAGPARPQARPGKQLGDTGHYLLGRAASAHRNPSEGNDGHLAEDIRGMSAIIVVFDTGRNWDYLKCPVTGAWLRKLHLQNTMQQGRGPEQSQEPLTLMKQVFPEAGFYLSLLPSIQSTSRGQAGSVLGGRDLQRKRLGRGGVGLENELFLTGPCLHGLGQDQGQGWQAGRLQRAQQGPWCPSGLSLIWLIIPSHFSPGSPIRL